MAAQEDRRGSARHAYPGRRSARAWWWTAGTGAALLVLLTAHMVANHFVVDAVGGLRSYHQVLDYIANPLILTIEGLLLVTVTIHALLGVRSVLLDLDPGPRARRLVAPALCLLGSLTVAYGLVLLALLASRA
jgi:succinate dehydrogenase hydrophobic anchor subunit